MAGTSLLMLIDDIATLLDDIAVLSKVAVQKTAGVLGDDLALNAQQVNGLSADRELPVVWAVAKGSMGNKAILVPAALLISYLIPWAVVPLLMLGGLYLCYEGVEKIAHKFLHSPEENATHHKELIQSVADTKVDLVAFEKEKIRGAIRTDFVLSAEIIVITLGAVAASTFTVQVAVLIAISLIMTVGVYGLVGGIVKLDDAGLALLKADGNSAWKHFLRRSGGLLVRISPALLRLLGILGTAAMFTVGGGIIVHGVHAAGEAVHHLAESAAEITHLGKTVEVLVSMVLNAVVGIFCGICALGIVVGIKRILPQRPSVAH